jgi:hypothetical protein
MLEYFFFASMLTLLTHAYFARRLCPSRSAPDPRRRAFVSLLVINVLVLPGSLVFVLRAPASTAWFAVPLAHIAFVDVSFCVLLVVALAARDLVMIVASIAARITRPWRASSEDPARRRLLLSVLGRAAVAGAGGAAAIGYGIALSQPELRRVRLSMRSMPSAWQGLRLVQISDLHVGPTVRRGYVETLVATVNDLAPDLIVITGDLVDGFVSQLADQIEPLRALRAPHGVLFVTGNHEYFYRASEWLTELRSMGISVLSNSHTIIEQGGASIVIAGLEDPVASSLTDPRVLALRDAVASCPESSLRILLTHRPNDVVAASANGFDLQLSGHVHAGQFFPFTWLTSWIETYSDGLYSLGKTWLYVNRGAGHWGPINRLGARQEVTLFEIGSG